MIRVGEDTFLSVMAMYRNVEVRESVSKVCFYHGEKVGYYDRLKVAHYVKSEDIRRLTGSGRSDSQ